MKKAIIFAYIAFALFTYGHAAVSFRGQYPDVDKNDNRAEIQALPVAIFAAPLYWSLRLNEKLASQSANGKEG